MARGVESEAHRRGVAQLAAMGFEVPGPKGHHGPTFQSTVAALLAAGDEEPDVCTEERWPTVNRSRGPASRRFGSFADYMEEIHGASGGLRPDAWRVAWVDGEPELQIGEVNVTSHADLRKWLWLWDLLEDGYDLRTTIVIVDRNGTVSQPWTLRDVRRLAFKFSA